MVVSPSSVSSNALGEQPVVPASPAASRSGANGVLMLRSAEGSFGLSASERTGTGRTLASARPAQGFPVVWSAAVRRFQRLALAAGAAATLALPGVAAEPSGSLRASLSLGYDSNARRVFNSTPQDGDAMGSVLLDALGRISPGPVDLSGSYTAAARKFAVLSS